MKEFIILLVSFPLIAILWLALCYVAWTMFCDIRDDLDRWK